ncbi:hypothetical protein CN977_17275 [Bacillus thuringiensis]|nr:hypothetical protein DX930_15965 [Bacillus cereus]MDR4147690.1 hypothetical protein [Bacillus thuringiensis]OTZ87012.1 hypothetical protein BK789_21850 [Bacillus thuringiensis serovar darmstadiensis]PDY99634.1 hypothetical protein CON12_17460 [Bacillus thuringiensis]PFO20838.1 hypothetical protein COJ79_10285 [Bacillus thuringiensis]
MKKDLHRFFFVNGVNDTFHYEKIKLLNRVNFKWKMDIINLAKKQLVLSDQLLFIFKVDEQKNAKVVGPLFTNIYYDKRRKVVCYQRFKEEGFYVSSLIKIDGS